MVPLPPAAAQGMPSHLCHLCDGWRMGAGAAEELGLGVVAMYPSTLEITSKGWHGCVPGY
jgi:hypothetical protein